MNFPRTWAGTMGHFDALCNCDKHIPKNRTSSAASVDSNRGVVRAELPRLTYVLTMAASRPTSLYVFLSCSA